MAEVLTSVIYVKNYRSDRLRLRQRYTSSRHNSSENILLSNSLSGSSTDLSMQNSGVIGASSHLINGSSGLGLGLTLANGFSNADLTNATLRSSSGYGSSEFGSWTLPVAPSSVLASTATGKTLASDLLSCKPKLSLISAAVRLAGGGTPGYDYGLASKASSYIDIHRTSIGYPFWTGAAPKTAGLFAYPARPVFPYQRTYSGGARIRCSSADPDYSRRALIAIESKPRLLDISCRNSVERKIALTPSYSQIQSQCNSRSASADRYVNNTRSYSSSLAMGVNTIQNSSNVNSSGVPFTPVTELARNVSAYKWDRDQEHDIKTRGQSVVQDHGQYDSDVTTTASNTLTRPPRYFSRQSSYNNDSIFGSTSNLYSPYTNNTSHSVENSTATIVTCTSSSGFDEPRNSFHGVSKAEYPSSTTANSISTNTRNDSRKKRSEVHRKENGFSSWLTAEEEQTLARAEARLAARRQARAEAREIRMKELEKQQKESEENADRHYDMYSTGNDVANRAAFRVALGSHRGPSHSVGSGSYHSSRRSSEDSSEDGIVNIRDMRHELKELEDKFRKSMVQNAQLDNEKSALTYHVELLKDKIDDLEESLSLLQREHKDKCRDFENLKRLSTQLKDELEYYKSQLQEKDELIKEYGLVVVESEVEVDLGNGERETRIKKTLVTQQTAQVLSTLGDGSLDVRLKKVLEEKNELLDEIRRLKLDLEEERNRNAKGDRAGGLPNNISHNSSHTMNGPDGHDSHDTQREASKQMADYRFKTQKYEQEITTLQANVARLETQVARFKTAAEEAESREDDLKVEKRKLQREFREAQSKVDELETTNSHLQKRLDKLKTAKSTLLKEL